MKSERQAERIALVCFAVGRFGAAAERGAGGACGAGIAIAAGGGAAAGGAVTGGAAATEGARAHDALTGRGKFRRIGPQARQKLGIAGLNPGAVRHEVFDRAGLLDRGKLILL